MIIVRLQGGLGNQLFQYAAGKALATLTTSQLKLERITSLGKKGHRNLELDNFNIDYQLATRKELKKFVPFPSFYRHRPSFFSKLNPLIYREREFSFDSNFFNLHGPVYLDGYWQSPKYFAGIQDTLEKEIEIKHDRIAQVEYLAQEFRNKPSVSVHIRRGDFTNPKLLAYHGVLGKEYYENAIQRISRQVPDATFFYFSDDITWVKENLSLPKSSVLVSSITRSSIEDFYLMSCCHHNIIANSSYSWWAAWLNKNREKIVIAPKNWFAVADINTSDLIPGNWIRI